MNMTKTKKTVLSALLLALLIILSRFVAIQTQLLVISFSFVPIMMSAIWLGPKYSMLIAALGDFIGAILFPFGSYFPGFTISGGIVGAVYGIFLKRDFDNKINERKFIIGLIISSILVLILDGIFLRSLWLNILYGKAFWVIVSSRVIGELIKIPIQIVSIYFFDKATRNYVDKYLLGD